MSELNNQDIPLLQVRLRRFKSLAKFIENYARLVGKSSVLLPTKQPTSMGDQIRFELYYGEGQLALEGSGEVQKQELDANGVQRAIIVSITDLSAETQPVFDQLIATRQQLRARLSGSFPAAEASPAHATDGAPAQSPAQVDANEASPTPASAAPRASTAITSAASTPAKIDIREQAKSSYITDPTALPADLFGEDDLESSLDSLFGGSDDSIFGGAPTASDTPPATEQPAQAIEADAQLAPEAAASIEGRALDVTPVTGVTAVEELSFAEQAQSAAALSATTDSQADTETEQHPVSGRPAQHSGSVAAVQALLQDVTTGSSDSAPALAEISMRHGMITGDNLAVPGPEDAPQAQESSEGDLFSGETESLDIEALEAEAQEKAEKAKKRGFFSRLFGLK